jgi:DNA end-binding protein Ku
MASTVWRGFITFGLISIPVRLFRAARPERVNLRKLYRAEAPRTNMAASRRPEESRAFAGMVDETPKSRKTVSPESVPAALARSDFALVPAQQVSVRKGSDEILAEKSLVKGYEYDEGRYVVVEPEELKSIAPTTTTEMQIEEFVNLAEVDPVYFETSYYVVPEDAGEKAYALLYRSLQTTGLVAVAQLAMHGREHVVIVRPAVKGLVAHTMFFSSEVRADEEHTAEVATITQKELDLAQALIHSLATSFEPQKYRDTYREKLESIIASRVAGQPAPVSQKPVRRAAVVDITEALQKSLAALKKPAASETPADTNRDAKRSGTGRKKISQNAG